MLSLNDWVDSFVRNGEYYEGQWEGGRAKGRGTYKGKRSRWGGSASLKCFNVSASIFDRILLQSSYSMNVVSLVSTNSVILMLMLDNQDAQTFVNFAAWQFICGRQESCRSLARTVMIGIEGAG